MDGWQCVGTTVHRHRHQQLAHLRLPSYLTMRPVYGPFPKHPAQHSSTNGLPRGVCVGLAPTQRPLLLEYGPGSGVSRRQKLVVDSSVRPFLRS